MHAIHFVQLCESLMPNLAFKEPTWHNPYRLSTSLQDGVSQQPHQSNACPAIDQPYTTSGKYSPKFLSPLPIFLTNPYI